MFSVLAWSRAFALALLLTSTPSYARQESLCQSLLSLRLSKAHITLVASSVTYCQPPETLLVQQFQIEYFPQNSSVVFNVSISSVVRLTFLSPQVYPHFLFSRQLMSMSLQTLLSMSME